MNITFIENKLTYFVGTFILAVAFLFPAMAFAATITVPGDEATVADAVAASSAGDTILLTANIVTTEQITINKAITLDGGGFTIDAAFVKTSNSNNSAVGVQSDNVLVKNLLVTSSADQPWPLHLHGINVYESTGVILEDITASDFEASGIVVNSSEVNASNITTFNNGWHAINVDQKTSIPAVLTINNTSVHGEVSPVPHIFVDDITKDVTVNDVDNQYGFEDFGDARVYTLTPPPFVRSGEIIDPTANEVVSGVVDFEASLVDEDGDDSVQWAVRAGTCAAGTGTVAGNVDGYSDGSSWDGASFTSSVDMTLMPSGGYCFVFNPTESSGDLSLRFTQDFILEYSDSGDKNQCKKGGWADFGFKNQGQCVRFVETGKDSR